MHIINDFNKKWNKLYKLLFLGSLLLSLGVGNLSPAHAQQSSAALIEISVNPSIGQSEDISVHVIISNPNNAEIRVLKWFTPLAELKEPMFNISRDGESLAYSGAIYKRAEPNADDYVTLSAGEKLSGDISISDLYDFSVSGNYQVTYNASSEKLYTTNNDRRLLPHAGALISNTTGTFITGRALPAADEISAQTVTGSNTFSTSCTPERQTMLIDARSAASTYADSAAGYFNANLQGARYTTWYGAYNLSRYTSVASNFNKIRTTVDTASEISFNCNCINPGVYAYVYPNKPYNIYLCKAFWSSPLTGSNSQAGTLIHAISHFNSIAGTVDYVTGQSGAKNLANTNPVNAIKNADNYEYFAENNPAAAESSPTVNYVEDPGFEAYTPSLNWAESSTNFDTPLCSIADCGNDPHAYGPHTGSTWGWFGATNLDETASLSQTVTIPNGTANLSFYFWMGSAESGSDANDVFTVDIDGTTIFSANATQQNSYSAYKIVRLNVNGFADGSAHTLTFKSVTTDQVVDFNLDDVLLTKTSLRLFTSKGNYDGWVLETSKNRQTGGTKNTAAATFNVGDNAANKQYRSILSFNTGAVIPYDAVITKAALKIKRSGIVGSGNPLTTFQGFYVDVKKGSFGMASLTINDFQAVVNQTLGPFTPALSSGWYTLNLINAESYINASTTNSGLTQIRLRFKLASNNNNKANFIKLYSGNAATASNRPKLVIEYYVP